MKNTYKRKIIFGKILAFIVLMASISLTFMACTVSNSSTPIGNSISGENGSGILENPSGTEKSTSNSEVTQPVVENKSLMVKSNVNGLSVRTGSSTAYTRIGSLDQNDMVKYCGEENGWYKTIYKERVAYVSKNYASIVKFDKGTDRAEKVIEEGLKLLGYPYVWGSQRYHWGNGRLNTDFVPGEYDCSALTLYCYYKADKTLLKLTSRNQSQQGTKLVAGQVKRGDLMFFTNSSRTNYTGIDRVGHVAIYMGDNYVLHTASDHAVVEPISSARWGNFLWGARV